MNSPSNQNGIPLVLTTAAMSSLGVYKRGETEGPAKTRKVQLNCGSKLNWRGNPQVLVHVSTQGNPFWNPGFLSHNHVESRCETQVVQSDGLALASLEMPPLPRAKTRNDPGEAPGHSGLRGKTFGDGPRFFGLERPFEA